VCSLLRRSASACALAVTADLTFEEHAPPPVLYRYRCCFCVFVCFLLRRSIWERRSNIRRTCPPSDILSLSLLFLCLFVLPPPPQRVCVRIGRHHRSNIRRTYPPPGILSLSLLFLRLCVVSPPPQRVSVRLGRHHRSNIRRTCPPPDILSLSLLFLRLCVLSPPSQRVSVRLCRHRHQRVLFA